LTLTSKSRKAGGIFWGGKRSSLRKKGGGRGRGNKGGGRRARWKRKGQTSFSPEIGKLAGTKKTKGKEGRKHLGGGCVGGEGGKREREKGREQGGRPRTQVVAVTGGKSRGVYEEISNKKNKTPCHWGEEPGAQESNIESWRRRK